MADGVRGGRDGSYGGRVGMSALKGGNETISIECHLWNCLSSLYLLSLVSWYPVIARCKLLQQHHTRCVSTSEMYIDLTPIFEG